MRIGPQFGPSHCTRSHTEGTVILGGLPDWACPDLVARRDGPCAACRLRCCSSERSAPPRTVLS